MMGKRRCIFRNEYKGLMDKTKGGVEAGEGVVVGGVGMWEWWWGNADNCT